MVSFPSIVVSIIKKSFCLFLGLFLKMNFFFRPNCELRVNLILGIDESLLEVCATAMPITHIKILYCDKFDFESMSKFPEFRDLKSLWYIGNKRSCRPNVSDVNPLVETAWICTKLEEIVFSGL